MVMDVRSAELTKYAANAMLATRICFMNELANLAERARRRHRARCAGHRLRSAHRLSLPLSRRAATAARCFPEGRARRCMRTAPSVGSELPMLAGGRGGQRARRSSVLVDKIVARFGADLAGRTFALWGLAFKPNTDDMREAPRRVLIEELARARRERASPTIRWRCDEARRVFGAAPHLRIAATPMAALRGRRRAGRRHRVEGVPQPRLRRASRERCKQPVDLRRPQPLRPGAGPRRRARVLRHRTRVAGRTCAARHGAPIFRLPRARRHGARAGRRRRHARPLLVRRRRAHLARGAGAGRQGRAHRGAPGRRRQRRAQRRGARRAGDAAVGGRRRRGRRDAGAPARRRARARRSLHRDRRARRPRSSCASSRRQQQLLRIDFETAPSHEVLRGQARRLRPAAARTATS